MVFECEHAIKLYAKEFEVGTSTNGNRDKTKSTRGFIFLDLLTT